MGPLARNVVKLCCQAGASGTTPSRRVLRAGVSRSRRGAVTWRSCRLGGARARPSRSRMEVVVTVTGEQLCSPETVSPQGDEIALLPRAGAAEREQRMIRVARLVTKLHLPARFDTAHPPTGPPRREPRRRISLSAGGSAAARPNPAPALVVEGEPVHPLDRLTATLRAAGCRTASFTEAAALAGRPVASC
jgi:hypothetical protein